MTRVALIRPGATAYDEQDRIQGVLDVPLSPRGRDEVAALVAQLAARPPLSALYCGPGRSATETADLIGKAIDVRPRPIDRLRNLDQGLWQGLQIDEVRRRSHKIYHQWVDAPETVCPPLGETVDEAFDRLDDVLRPLLKRHRDETFGLVLAEPCAQLAASYLRFDPLEHLEEHPLTGNCEWIDVAAAVLRNNGRAARRPPDGTDGPRP